MDTWKTSVGELLHIFRSALAALLPAMQRARIPWKPEEAYDEWDEISQALYRNILARSLRAALGEQVELDTVLPRYDMKLESYFGRGVLLVSSSEVSGFAVFVGLSSNHEPFDTIDCVLVDESGAVSSNIVKKPFDTALISFSPAFGDKLGILDELCIEL